MSSDIVSCCSTLPPLAPSPPRICMLSCRLSQSKTSMPKAGTLTKPHSPSIRKPDVSLQAQNKTAHHFRCGAELLGQQEAAMQPRWHACIPASHLMLPVGPTRTWPALWRTHLR